MRLKLLSYLLLPVLFASAAADIAVPFQNVQIEARDGKLCTMKKHRKVSVTAVSGSIVSLSASDNLCIAATADGLLYRSDDAKNWKMTDFNAEYSEYYGEITVRCVCASKAGLMLAGTRGDGSPAVFESAEGSVWSERELTYSEGNSIVTLSQQPVSLAYDNEHERFEMACTGGVTFLLPGCSHCNAMIRTK